MPITMRTFLTPNRIDASTGPYFIIIQTFVLQNLSNTAITATLTVNLPLPSSPLEITLLQDLTAEGSSGTTDSDRNRAAGLALSLHWRRSGCLKPMA